MPYMCLGVDKISMLFVTSNTNLVLCGIMTIKPCVVTQCVVHSFVLEVKTQAVIVPVETLDLTLTGIMT